MRPFLCLLLAGFAFLEILGAGSFFGAVFRSGPAWAKACFLLGVFGFAGTAYLFIQNLRKQRVGMATAWIVLIGFMPVVTSLPILGIPFVDVYWFGAAFCAVVSAFLLGSITLIRLLPPFRKSGKPSDQA